MSNNIHTYFQNRFTQSSKEILEFFFDKLHCADKDLYRAMMLRFERLNDLLNAISSFPSLFETQETVTGKRTMNTLVDSLLSTKTAEKTLFLPTKGNLTKDFLIAQFQFFIWVLKTAQCLEFSTKEIKSIRHITIETMFTVMAIDVYLALISDSDIDEEKRKKIAHALILLWDKQTPIIDLENFFSILNNIWAVRDKIAPAFGTMVGTSELLLLTIEMDEKWNLFIREKLSEPDISKSLEEFIFGLSHEQIGILKKKIQTTSKSLSRDEVYKELDGNEFYLETEFEPRNFYQMYSLRRDNARARKRMGICGPKKTLEEFYIKFILERFENTLFQ
ncbi:MAG: hypothetical protein ACRC5H_00310 [Treponemataceae bacterium]